MAKKIGLEVDIKSTSIGEATKQTQTLKSELRQLQEQLASGKLSGAEFDQAARRAGELRDAIGDANARINVLASDTKKLDTLVSVGQGIAGGFSAAQGAMAVFGAENEDLTKQLVKIQGAMALLNGTQAIAATLNKDSAASVMILSTAQRVAAVSTRIWAAATTLLSKALIATGIGALIVGLGLLIANFDKVVKFVQMAIEKFRNMGSGVKNLISVIFPLIGIIRLVVAGLEELGVIDDDATRKMKKNAEAQEKIRKQNVKDLNKEKTAIEDKYNTEIALAKAAGKDTFEIEKKKRAELMKTLFALNQLEKARIFSKEATKEEIKEWNERQKTLRELQLNEQVAVLERETELENKRKEARAKRAEALKAENEKKKKEDEKLAEDKKKEEERIADEAKKAEEKRVADVLQIQNDYNRQLIELSDKTEMDKINRQEGYALMELDLLNATEQQKQAVIDFYAAKRKEQEAIDAKEAAKTAKERADAIIAAQWEIVNQGSAALGSLAELSKENSNLQKGLVLTQIAVDTASAIASLVRNSEANPLNAPTSGVAGALQFASGLARILSGVAQAKRVLSGGGAGGASGGGQGGQQFRQPQFNTGLDIRAFERGDSRVYVVENDITRAQRRVAQLKENAVID